MTLTKDRYRIADVARRTEVLESAPLDGPCDDSCGCVRGPSEPVTLGGVRDTPPDTTVLVTPVTPVTPGAARHG